MTESEDHTLYDDGYSDGYDEGWEAGYKASIDDDEAIMSVRTLLDEFIASLMNDRGERFLSRFVHDNDYLNDFGYSKFTMNEALYMRERISIGGAEGKALMAVLQAIQNALGGRPNEAQAPPPFAPKPSARALAALALADNKTVPQPFLSNPFTGVTP